MNRSSRAFWHLVFVGLTGVPTFMTTYYYYQLLTQIGLLLVLPIGAFIAGQIWLILWLRKQDNPTLAAIGRAFGVAFQYLALFQALMLTVFVFYVLGGGETAGGRNAFLADFVIGSLYLSVFIYGATGLALFFGPDNFGPRIAGSVYAAIAIGPPLWLSLAEEPAIREAAASQPGVLVLAILGYYLVMSVLGMWLLVGHGSGPSGDPGPAVP